MENNEAVRFFRAMYGELRSGECIELRHKKGVRIKQAYFDDFDRAASKAKAISTTGEVFFGIALRDGGGGKKDNIVRIPCIWADLDEREGMSLPIHRLAKRPSSLEPSAVVASGRGLHVYWFLEESVGPEDIPRIEHLNKAIAKRMGGDSVHDASRVFRVPGTLNWKYGEPRHVSLMGLAADYRYKIEHMFSALGCEEPEPPLVNIYTPQPGLRSESSLACRNEIWKGVEEGSRNAACFQLAVDLKRSGVSREVAMSAIEAWSRLCRPRMEMDEVRESVKSAYQGSYTGLGCDKMPMAKYCAANCRVKVGVRGQGIGNSGKEGEGNEKSLPTPNPQPITPSSPSPTSLPVWTPTELAGLGMNPPDFVVEGLVPARGVTMITGEGGIGKSFIVLDMACAVAAGGKFLSRFKCAKKPVLIVDLENDEHTIGRRLRKVAKGRNTPLDGLGVYVVRKSEMSLADIRIDTPAGRSKLEATIECVCPGVLVIDPMVAIHGQDENNNIAMRQVVMVLEELSRTHEMGVVIVHHHRKRGLVNDPGQMMRGASDLRNAAVSHISMKKLGRDRIAVEHDKCRQAEAVEGFMVEMADSEDGGEIYMKAIEGAVSGGQKNKRDLAKEIIMEALGDGEVHETSTLLARCVAVGITNRTSEDTLARLVHSKQIHKPSRGFYSIREQLTFSQTES